MHFEKQRMALNGLHCRYVDDDAALKENNAVP